MEDNANKNRGLQLEQHIHIENHKLNKKEEESWTQKEKTRRKRLNRDKKLAHYNPWGAQDLEELISRLPNMHSGASKWIRIFEEGTMEHCLAVGNVKALLSRVLGLVNWRAY